MRTLHLETGRHMYGGALQVLYLVRGLVERGFEAKVLAPAESAIAERAKGDGLPVETFRFRGEGDALGAAQMVSRIKGWAPELVHIHSRRGADTWGEPASALTRTPTVLTRRVDNPEPAWSFPAKYGRYRHVIAISGAIERMLLDRGLPRERLTKVWSAVDVAEWSIPDGREALEREFDLPAGVPVGAMVAQFIDRKGHAVLVDALRGMMAEGQKGSAPVIVLFGQGPLESRTRDEAEAIGVADHLRFAGFRTDLPRWLGSFDFCVHPALMEGLGVAALQAGAAGLPVVGSDAGGIPEIVIHEETGLLTMPGEGHGVAEAIRRVVKNLDQAKVWGMRAKKRVTDCFSVDAMVEGNLVVYRKVLGIS
ncbi:MAG: glycosyltransferase family 4 protein [Longimicrobiales bacterium]